LGRKNVLIVLNASCAAAADVSFAGKEGIQDVRLNLGHV